MTAENVELEPEDLPLIELPPLVAGEHRLGIQVSVAGAVKGKLDESAGLFSGHAVKGS